MIAAVRSHKNGKEKTGKGGGWPAYGLVDLPAEVGLPCVGVLVLRGTSSLRHLSAPLSLSASRRRRESSLLTPKTFATAAAGVSLWLCLMGFGATGYVTYGAISDPTTTSNGLQPKPGATLNSH